MGERPWFKFYPTDWRADQALRLCSAAARGLWLECLCLMHEAQPYGHLLVNGKPVNDAQLAALTGVPSNELAALIAELEAAGVFTRTAEGVISSRRMIRDEARAELRTRNGKRGGNPTLIKVEDNLEVILDDNPRGQRPEVRIQNQNQNQNQNQKDSDLDKYDSSPSGLAESSRQIPIPRRFGANQPWTAEQKKVAWQSRVCAWAQAELPAEAYANFLMAWANGERWATRKAEEFSAAMNAAKARKAVGDN